MAYSADTFVADEQPTTAKWNKLWSNDASFNDGSGLNNLSNPIVANSANHLVLTPGTNKFVKIAVLRQDNTTNAYKNNSIMLTGWGLVAYPAASNVTDTVTYGITFDAIPIPVGVFGGDHSSSSTYGAGGNLVEGLLHFKIHTPTTTTFVAQIHKYNGGGNFAAGNAFYQWQSIGELA